MKVSDCCGEEDRLVGYNGPSYSDIMICPGCRDHCVFEEQDETTLDNEAPKCDDTPI